MPSLKEFRNRIASVKSTRKITSAMKMVAASKLRKAQTKAEESRAYSNHMIRMISNLLYGADIEMGEYPILSGTGRDKTHLLIVLTSDNGLCGSFNSSVIRLAAREVNDLLFDKKDVKIITLGRKGGVFFRREYPRQVIESIDDFGHKDLSFKDASEVSAKILAMLKEEEFDICSVVYNEFVSVIYQSSTVKQLIPFNIDDLLNNVKDNDLDIMCASESQYMFEPDRKTIFKELLPLNFSLQLFRAMLDNSAGEKAARMTAMDSATNNADTMIENLTLKYNRARQAYITKELIEIISGAEAV